MRQITISGNLGKDPEIRTTQSGTQVANFNVAVRQNRPDDQGNYGTDWFRCSVWGKAVSRIERFYHKGSHVTLTGSFEVSEYNGNTQLGINVSDFDLPERTNGQGQSQSAPQVSRQQQASSSQIDINDDDLPF